MEKMQLRAQEKAEETDAVEAAVANLERQIDTLAQECERKQKHLRQDNDREKEELEYVSTCLTLTHVNKALSHERTRLRMSTTAISFPL